MFLTITKTYYFSHYIIIYSIFSMTELKKQQNIFGTYVFLIVICTFINI